MALETADILKQFGFDPEKITDAESFKKQFNETYISREVAVDDVDIKNKIMGRRIGGIHTKTKRIFTDLGVEFTGDELKDIKVEDLMDLGIGKLNDVLKSKETELKSTFESTKDETVIKLNGQIETLNGRVTELDVLNTENVQKLTDANENFAGKIKEFKLGSLLSDSKRRVKILTDTTEFEKDGYEARISKKVHLDFNDKEELLILDENGNRIKNESGNNFATLDEVLTGIAKEGNILQQNNSNSSNARANAFAGNGNTNNNDNNSNGKAVQLHPAATA